MLSLPDRASVQRAIAAADPRLASLLSARLTLSDANGIADLTHYLVIRPGDTEADVIDAVGFSPLVNPLDNVRHPDPAFLPWWDWLHDLGGWFEMIIAVGNEGFAFILLIEDQPDVDTSVLHVCRAFKEN